MSGNTRSKKPQADRRVRRTRHRLGHALVELVQEKPFEEITVKEVLDRASVGRSTFYEHYRDKDDLFSSDLDEFLERLSGALERAGDTSERVAPVKEFFEHVGGARRLLTALVRAGKIQVFQELAQGHFARAIERRLAARADGKKLLAQERAALSHMLAGALLSLLTWWLYCDQPFSAQEADDRFHALVRGGLAPG